MTEVTKINAMSFAKISALMWAFVGFIIGILLGLVLFAFGSVISSDINQLKSFFGVTLGIIGFVGVPIIFALFGFINGLLFAWFYNLLSWWTGGIKIELKKQEEEGEE